MKLVSTAELQPGMIVGRTLWHEDGRVLLSGGVRLTPDYIRALVDKGFTRIFIKDPDIEHDIEPDDDLSPATRAKAMKALNDSFGAVSHEVRMLRSRSFNDIKDACASDAMRSLTASDGPLKNVHAAVGQIIDEVLQQATLAGLSCIQSESSAAYDHAIDVCVLACMIGQNIRLNNVRLRQLATGCLLHDIGMVFLDGGLDEKVRIRQHTMLGFELLRNNPDPDILAPHVAYEHHEHQDGSGSPRGLVGSNTLARDRTLSPPIPALIGEIAAVANLYSNLIRGTKRTPQVPPDLAVKGLIRVSGTRLNQEVVAAFLRVVPVYPVGTEVTVTSGAYANYSGVVAEVHRDNLSRPVVVLFRNRAGKPIDPVRIDLRELEDVTLRCKKL